jgi:hypothetical protein
LTCFIQSQLSVYQKGAHYTWIKVFNRLPIPIKQLSHDKNNLKWLWKVFHIPILFTYWRNISNTIQITFLGCLYDKYELIDVTEFLLQSSFRNPIEFYYNWIVILCMMYDVWWLGSVSRAVYVCMYFDMFCIQWHHLAKKDLWNKVYVNECCLPGSDINQFGINILEKYAPSLLS